MKCYVYYKGGDMKEFKPLNPNYEPTSVLTRAAVVDDSPTIRKDLIDGTIEDNKGKAFVAMQLRSVGCDNLPGVFRNPFIPRPADIGTPYATDRTLHNNLA